MSRSEPTTLAAALVTAVENKNHSRKPLSTNRGSPPRCPFGEAAENGETTHHHRGYYRQAPDTVCLYRTFTSPTPGQPEFAYRQSSPRFSHVPPTRRFDPTVRWAGTTGGPGGATTLRRLRRHRGNFYEPLLCLTFDLLLPKLPRQLRERFKEQAPVPSSSGLLTQPGESEPRRRVGANHG